MVDRQLRRRGIADERVLDAMGEVPRELFVEERLRRRAYADGALPTSAGQTISQPWVVAAITEALELRGGEKVLEIGTGTGYSTAILASLAAEVISIERHSELAEAAIRRLGGLGIGNVEVRVGDGVEVKRAKDLSPRDIEHDNPEFRRVDETLGFMRQIYGREIDLDETVTVVRFSQIVERPPSQYGNGETPSRN